MVESARSLRALVSGMACLFCMVILVSITTENGGRTEAIAPLAAAPVGSLQSSSTDRPIDQMNSDPFFATKRRVPNGPDPIHNRRIGKSGRPPGRA